MKFDVVIVGGGIAGLTSAAFLVKSGYKVLLCEKEDRVGGLIGSFQYQGFTFDSGIRAMENSGVLFPMLKQLGINIEFKENTVSIGMCDRVVTIFSETSIDDYQSMLVQQFPNHREEIASIIAIVRKSMSYMDVLYGIDNPLFFDLKNDLPYVRDTLMPWLLKYLATLGKIKKLNQPVEKYLKTLTQNQELIDMIAQHFFTQTPASFALSYFSLYLDYNYPAGGTGSLIAALAEFIREHDGIIQENTFIQTVDPVEKTITDANGNVVSYDELIWAADSNALYASLRNVGRLPRRSIRKIQNMRSLLKDKKGGNSVLTLYLTAALDKSYFEKIHSPHFFYTPEIVGLSSIPIEKILNEDGSFSEDQDAIFAWVQTYLSRTTYEISIPCMRDETLAPENQTGLIISTLMDYSLVEYIESKGWYAAFKQLCQDTISATLIASVYPSLDGKITGAFVSTPLTIKNRTGNTDGAITGWAFTNSEIPAISSMPKIASSVKTPIPDILQVGQWTYSPSGFPISILTGKMAADAAAKQLKR